MNLQLVLTPNIRASLWLALKHSEMSTCVFPPSAYFFFPLVKLSPAFHLCFAFFAMDEAPTFIQQTPRLDFMGTAIVPNILTGVVTGRNGASSLKHCV